MVDKAHRKDLLQQYAERAPQVGVFAVRNSATGEVWVGASRNLDVQKNGLWVRLSTGTCFNRDVQASWTKHGEAAFNYEVLERFTENDPHVLERLRLERPAHWREALGGGTVKGT